MEFWILVTLIGALLTVVGVVGLARRYRAGEVSGRMLAAVVVGLLSFVAYAVVSALRPDLGTGAVSLALLLPAFVAIVLVVREHQKASGPAL